GTVLTVSTNNAGWRASKNCKSNLKDYNCLLAQQLHKS
ncbi:hypothetical protein SS7213T_03315, partial [Staphylococcus simiae CCM 7213 = CCUG 51256]